MFRQTDDVRIRQLKQLIAPSALMAELPISEPVSALVAKTRDEVAAVLHGHDDRLLVVVGPCSVHDPDAALEYAGRLAELATRYRDELLIVDARLFREAAHHRRLEGTDQRPASGRQLRDQRRPEARATAAARLDELGCRREPSSWTPIAPQFHRRPRVVGRDRRAHVREPGAPRARVGTVDAGGIQERHRWHDRKWRSTPCGRRRTPHQFPRRHEGGRRRDRRDRAAIPTATSSCAAAAPVPNYGTEHIERSGRRAQRRAAARRA